MWYSRHPVPQAVEHQLPHDRVVAVERVAAAAEVVVVAFRREHVVRRVVEPAERDRRAAFVAFGRVVEHDVEHHLDAVLVQLLDQRLELVDLHAELRRSRRSRPWGRRSRPCCSPSSCSASRRCRIDCELFSNSSNSKIGISSTQLTPSSFRYGIFFRRSGERAGVANVRRRMPREAADVHLVDDQVFGGNLQRAVVLPVEVVVKTRERCWYGFDSSRAPGPTRRGRRSPWRRGPAARRLGSKRWPACGSNGPSMR